MTREEFAILAMSIKAVYTNLFPDDNAISVWYALLKDLPYRAAADALQKHLQTSKFPPTVADIRQGAIPQPEEDTSELEAWAMVHQAIRCDPEQAKEQYDRLPPVIQKAVGSVSNLCQWGYLPSEEVGTVIQSQFLRSYRQVKDRAKEEAVISPALRERMAQLGKEEPAFLPMDEPPKEVEEKREAPVNIPDWRRILNYVKEEMA